MAIYHTKFHGSRFNDRLTIFSKFIVLLRYRLRIQTLIAAIIIAAVKLIHVSTEASAFPTAMKKANDSSATAHHSLQALCVRKSAPETVWTSGIRDGGKVVSTSFLMKTKITSRYIVI